MTSVWLITLLFAAAACSGPVSQEEPVQVKAGNTFTLELPANVAVGYRWRLAAPLNPDLLELVEQDTQPAERDEEGAPGKETWTFKALKAGKTQVVLEFNPPWLKERVADAQVRTYSIEIL